jgi:dihydrofolate synthase/folylpolyglutamate synthase
MDHAEYLGDSVAAIAGEKAGILKRGVPVVTAETDPGILELFRTRAAALGVPVTLVGRGIDEIRVGEDGTDLHLRGTGWGDLSLQTPLTGAHQAVNLAVAVRMLDLLPDGLRPDAQALLDGVAGTRWPGRVQVLHRQDGTWVFDVAHNVAGVAALSRTLSALSVPKPVVVLVGILGDKDWPAMLPGLFSLADHVVLTQPPTAPVGRRWDPEAVVAQVGGETPLHIEEDFSRALGRARGLSSEGTVVVTGSVHTVGDALVSLGIDPFPS